MDNVHWIEGLDMNETPAPAQKPRDSIFRYAVVLFSVAFILVLLSYLAQERARHSQELAGEAAAVMTVRQTLDHITGENQRLTDENASLSAHAAILYTRATELEQFLEASREEREWLHEWADELQYRYDDLLAEFVALREENLTLRRLLDESGAAP